MLETIYLSIRVLICLIKFKTRPITPVYIIKNSFQVNQVIR